MNKKLLLLVASLALFAGCATKPPTVVPVALETHAVRAGEIRTNDQEAAFDFVSQLRAAEAVVIIYDASGSMRWPIRQGGEARYVAAHKAITDYVKKLQPKDQVGLIVFGSQAPSGAFDGRVNDMARAQKSCRGDILLKRSLDTFSHNDMQTALAPLAKEGSYRGDTPIGGAIQKAVSLLEPVQGRKKRIVLMTDGMEECYPGVKGAPNPRVEIDRAKELEITLDIVFSGGGLNAKGEPSARSEEDARSLSKLASGVFLEADSYEGILNALMQMEIAKFSYQLLDLNDKVAITARIGERVTVPSGKYLFKGLTAAPFTLPVALPSTRSVRIFLGLTAGDNATPEILVQAEK